jgi:hypothetical protein
LADQRIPEESSSCRYLGIILRNDLSWADQVNYTIQKTWKIFHVIMPVLKKGNSNTKRLAYMSLVRPMLEYGISCWDPYREGQTNALELVQKKSGPICKTYERFGLGKTARIRTLFKAYAGEEAWKSVEERLIGPRYLCRDDHDRKIKARNKRTAVRKLYN